jgi:hypothetical protein
LEIYTNRLAGLAAGTRAKVDGLANSVGLKSLKEVLDDLRRVLLDEHLALGNEDASGAEDLVDLLDGIRRTREERSSGVGDGHATARAAPVVRLATELVVSDLELPVTLLGDRGVAEGARVVRRISSYTKKSDTKLSKTRR